MNSSWDSLLNFSSAFLLMTHTHTHTIPCADDTAQDGLGHPSFTGKWEKVMDAERFELVWWLRPRKTQDMASPMAAWHNFAMFLG